MSEIAGRTGHRTPGADVVHESYAFACMRCGHGWEQSYEIEHHRDADGAAFVTYVADGLVVPSPLSRPTCVNCDAHVVRIMRAGQVSSVLASMRRAQPPALPQQAGQDPAGPERGPEHGPEHKDHHWHLSDLLHPFQHRRAS
ncbi:hypothetical protein ACIPJS_33510 [Streptomyces sp. NPDC086783]|uniref:hypothetical protein n=1 Tax=Streptomyces sp. NPDC086783 TaxID=3365758 RepID=UPI003802D7AF